MKEKFDLVVEAARANPLRFAGWILAAVVLFVAAVLIGDGVGVQLYLFTH